MINIGLSPNFRLGDGLLAFKLIFQPWKWKKGKEVVVLENWFKKYLKTKNVYAFNSGRSAEYAILKAMGIGEGDEVLVQAFTCVAVPNSVLWLGAKPIFVDIEEETLDMDPADLERKITLKSKAIIIQHTFGILAKIDKILEIGKNHNLFVIEDCGHIIKKKIEGDAAFFSFGRDKAVSGVFGGLAIINEKFKIQSLKFKEFQQKSPHPSLFWIFQQLLHPVASALILPLYDLEIGKLILWTLQKLHLLSFPVYPEEKRGLKPDDFPAKMPNALAELVLNQLKSLDDFNRKRLEIVKFYEEKLKNLPIKTINVDALPLLRYPLLVGKARQLRDFAETKGIILGTWYSHIIDPEGVDFKKVNYQLGSCPVAEGVAKQVINLPTYPRMTLDDAYEVVKIVYEFFGKKF